MQTNHLISELNNSLWFLDLLPSMLDWNFWETWWKCKSCMCYLTASFLPWSKPQSCLHLNFVFSFVLQRKRKQSTQDEDAISLCSLDISVSSVLPTSHSIPAHYDSITRSKNVSCYQAVYLMWASIIWLWSNDQLDFPFYGSSSFYWTQLCTQLELQVNSFIVHIFFLIKWIINLGIWVDYRLIPLCSLRAWFKKIEQMFFLLEVVGVSGLAKIPAAGWPKG